MKTFYVTVHGSIPALTTIIIEAESEEAASKKAVEMAKEEGEKLEWESPRGLPVRGPWEVSNIETETQFFGEREDEP